jgi:hypothetical protein
MLASLRDSTTAPPQAATTSAAAEKSAPGASGISGPGVLGMKRGGSERAASQLIAVAHRSGSPAPVAPAMPQQVHTIRGPNAGNAT